MSLPRSPFLGCHHNIETGVYGLVDYGVEVKVAIISPFCVGVVKPEEGLTQSGMVPESTVRSGTLNQQLLSL